MTKHLYICHKDMQADLKIINFWNIEGRYPDYRNLGRNQKDRGGGFIKSIRYI
jgi:hypothetical protein